VVLLAVASVVRAADTDSADETVSASADFASAPGLTKARIVQNVKVFLDPAHAIPAKIVKHLPSHTHESEESESDAAPHILGNVFETSNFEADQVLETDSEALESTETAAAADAMRFRSDPMHKLKAKWERAAPAAVVADGLMLREPPGKPTDANIDPTSPAALNAQKAPEQIMDDAAVRASHLYIGYEDPNHLPDGTVIKRPVDKSGKFGTEAGTNFQFNKRVDQNKKCANGCTVRTPVMVGYRGIREHPAESTREVRMPGDRSRWRMIHSEYKVPARHSWHPVEIKAGHQHLKRASYRIDKLRMKRKAYENTALNRDVVMEQNVPPSGLVNAP